MSVPIPDPSPTDSPHSLAGSALPQPPVELLFILLGPAQLLLLCVAFPAGEGGDFDSDNPHVTPGSDAF